MTRTVLAAVDDMFFAAKIRATAEHLGVEIRFARTIDALLNSAKENRPVLIISDLQSQKIDPFELAKRLQADEELRTVPLLGFFSHVMAELQRQAKDSGFTTVIPRSVFATKLPEILSGQF